MPRDIRAVAITAAASLVTAPRGSRSAPPKRLFNCAFANVQAHSGWQANQAVLLALLRPGDTIMGMSLAAGGHLTHGAAPNLSGKWFRAVTYGVRSEDGILNYEELEHLARTEKPKLIIAGGSAYA